MLKILWPLSFKEAPYCVFKSISNFWNKQNEFVDFMIVGNYKNFLMFRYFEYC